MKSDHRSLFTVVSSAVPSALRSSSVVVVVVVFFFFLILFAHLHIYFTKLHYHTTYITILKLHTTYILAVLVVYNVCTLFLLPTLQETNKQNKTNTEINMYHNSYFRLLFTLLATQKLVKSLLTFKID